MTSTQPHSHNGKVSVAPCGHTGEVIVGRYVRCLVGCEGAPVIPKRGVVGHVVNCACKPCRIRRLTTHIVLRDKSGKDWMKVEWDGIADVLELEATKSGYLRGYIFLDKEGKVVARGTTDASLAPGTFTLKLKFMVDSIIKCEVAHEAIYQPIDVLLDNLIAHIQAVMGFSVAPAQPGTITSGTLPTRVVIGP